MEPSANAPPEQSAELPQEPSIDPRHLSLSLPPPAQELFMELPPCYLYKYGEAYAEAPDRPGFPKPLPITLCSPKRLQPRMRFQRWRAEDLRDARARLGQAEGMRRSSQMLNMRIPGLEERLGELKHEVACRNAALEHAIDWASHAGSIHDHIDACVQNRCYLYPCEDDPYLHAPRIRARPSGGFRWRPNYPLPDDCVLRWVA